MSSLELLQRRLPAGLKNFLKPYYRVLFPNRLHVLFWVTFRCNYRCSYCPVVTKHDYTTHYPLESERSAEEWLTAFDKLPPALIYISGGEPLLYKGLPDFINKTRHSILGMVTNASVGVERYEMIQKRLHLNLSFHREFVTEDKFLAKVEQLRRRFHLNVNIVATPENLPLIETIEQRFRDRRVSLHVDPFVDPNFRYNEEQQRLLTRVLQRDRSAHVNKQLDFSDYDVKRCSAGKNYINVMPNGDVFTCMGGAHYTNSPLVKDVLDRSPSAPYSLERFKMGNLFDSAFKLRSAPLQCALPCTHACDLDAAIIERVGPAKPRTALPLVEPG